MWVMSSGSTVTPFLRSCPPIASANGSSKFNVNLPRLTLMAVPKACCAQQGFVVGCLDDVAGLGAKARIASNEPQEGAVDPAAGRPSEREWGAWQDCVSVAPRRNSQFLPSRGCMTSGDELPDTTAIRPQSSSGSPTRRRGAWRAPEMPTVPTDRQGSIWTLRRQCRAPSASSFLGSGR